MSDKLISILDIEAAYQRIKGVVNATPFALNENLSSQYGCNVLLKREDLQVVRSYKLRGAYNKISALSKEDQKRGIVCASAGNHAQGVAYSCKALGIKGKIYMPATTPRQKIRQVAMFGGDMAEIVLTGDTYDDAYNEAIHFANEQEVTFIHPFDDLDIAAGQGTVGLEMLRETDVAIDILLVPVGGGGLISGVGSYFKQISPKTKIIAVEPEGAPSMKNSLEAGEVITLEKIEKFVDGAAVKRVGDKIFPICQKVIDEVVLVPEGRVCTTILQLYNEDAMVVEPAGALTIAALEILKDRIKGKNVACIVSGGNNDITRTEEIKERSLLYEGIKHYFIVRFPQRAGALREFLVNILGPNDDITHFEYTKKNSREQGPALVGIEQKQKSDFQELITRMDKYGINYELINHKPDLFNLLI